jgi:hypothetical protein
LQIVEVPAAPKNLGLVITFDAESLSDVYGPQPMLEMLQTTGFPE